MNYRVLVIAIAAVTCLVCAHVLAVVLLAAVMLATLLVVHLLIVAVVTVGAVLLSLAWAISQAATETGWRIVPCVLRTATA